MMDAQTVRTALGTLQNNSEADNAWQQLREALASDDGDLGRAEALALLLAAKERHQRRGEADAVARLLELSIEIASEAAEQARLWSELSQVRLTSLFDGAGAVDALKKAASLEPGEPLWSEQLAELEGRAAAYKTQAASYQAEAEGAADDEYRSAMLMRACEVEVCFAAKPRFSSLSEDLEMALRLDSSNLPAARLLEIIYRRTEDTPKLIRVLERAADRAPDLRARIAAGVRLARIFQNTELDEERAAKVFDRVLESEPAHPDAIAFVTDYYARTERWDDLVRVYERPLKVAGEKAPSLGDMLQVAMLHWKKRGALADAEPWFARIRSLEPAHEGMLTFYREYKRALNDDAGLAEVLEGARASLGEEAPERVALDQELSSHATAQADAHREIEESKAALRENPDDEAIRERLKVLYKQTQGHNALIELLRQQLERTPEEATEDRLSVLRQIASVYREYVKSETALVGILNQIVQLDGKLDEQDVGEVRELVALYDRLGRPRDLLASQKLLAEIVPDPAEKKVLYRQVGRRWLEQFSNVQHAMEAFAALHELDPEDEEAIERLEDLYRKRRAWKELFALYEQQLVSKLGESRIPMLREMAQLAAERLSRVPDALAFYREILDIDPSRAEVLDRFEKHAERAKDWVSLADALERRLKVMPEDESRLPVLQKLGTVYGEHLDRSEEAIGTWRRVVQVQPANPRAMRVLRDTYLKAGRYAELETLYVEQNDLEGLAEVLSTAADRAKDAEAKLDLSYRAARVYEEGLQQSARAIRSYERILSIDPTDVRAIDRLLPLYENDDKWVRVPPLLEVKLEAATAPEDKFQIFEQLTIVASQHLLDRRGAVAYARRAYEEFPQDPRSMDLLDSASRASGAWEEMIAALESRLAVLGLDPVALAVEAKRLSAPPPRASESAAPAETTEPPAKRRRRRKRKGQASQPSAAPEPEERASLSPLQVSLIPEDQPTVEIRKERRAVSLRLARILGEEMARADEAVARLKMLAQDGAAAFEEEDTEVFSLLENLLRRQSRPEDIRWLFEHRAGRARSDEDRLPVLLEWAGFEERSAANPEGAIRLYRQVLELDPGAKSSLEALARLSLEQKDSVSAMKAFESLRDLLDGKERADKDVILAGLYEASGRPADALAAVQRALEAEVEPGRAIAVLQRLVEIQAVRGDAARILTEQYEAGGDARKEADALRAVIAETRDPAEKSELVLRLSMVCQQKLAEPGGALAVVIDGLKSRTDDMVLWERAEELAQLSGRTVELADAYRDLITSSLPQDLLVDLSRRAGKLHEDVLGDPIGAAPYYEKVLSVDPDDDDAFIRLKEILTSAERWQELDNLYEREIARLEDGTRRMEMLAEVALLAEDITGDVRRAVEFHQRILELEPEYAASLDALDRLYTRLGEKERLVDLLSHRAEMLSSTERLSMLLRIATLALELLKPDRAMSAVETVLTEDLGNYEARELAEKLLEIGSVRLRAAKALEAVYESRDEIRDLVRVLTMRLDILRPSADSPSAKTDAENNEDERRELLRRIATLRDDRLHDDVGSFDVFAELVPLDPEDVELRERLVDSGRRLSRYQQVVDVLIEAAGRAGGAAARCEILLQAAEIQLDGLEDAESAEKTLAAVITDRAEEADAALTAARLVETILVKANRNEDLYANLKLQTELEGDPERKAELLARTAELAVTQLDDTAGAIAAWEQRLEENPDDLESLQNLTELYEKEQRFEDLKRVLEQRRDAAVLGAERGSIIRHLADVEERHLGNTDRAIDAYQSILDEGAGDAATLRSLIRLYGKAERFEELADALLQQADVVEEPSEELESLFLLGKVRTEKLQDVPGALDAYRRALSLDQGHEPSLGALGDLLRHGDPQARLDAAAILEPIFEAAARAEDRYQVLVVQADATDDPAVRVDALRRAGRLAEDALDDPQRAFDAALRGLRAAVAQGDVGEWMVRIDRLARVTGGYRQQAEILEELGPEFFDPDQQLAAQKKVAELKRAVLGELDGAIEAYERALEVRPGDRESLLALEEIYEQKGAYAELLNVIERRADSSTDDEERKVLAYRRAELLASQLAEPERAILAYESIIDLDLEARAIAALEGLYAASERFDDWTSLIQRQIDAAPTKAVELRVKLAEILADRLEETDRALDEIDAALAENRQHGPSIGFLEKLMGRTEDRVVKGRVAAMLEPIYMARAEYERVLTVLGYRLACADEPGERRDLVSRISKIHEEQREDYAAALEATAQLLADEPGDESVVEELERLAKVAGAEGRLAELYEQAVLSSEVDDEALMTLAARAGGILARSQKDERALALLSRALAFDPERQDLFDLVDMVLRRLDRPEALVQLYRQTLEHRFEPGIQVKLLHQIASLEKERLNDPSAAIEAHQRVLELDEGNLTSLDELTILLASEERFGELAELYQRRAELVPPGEAARYRLALAALYKNRLDQPEAALDQLEEIVRETPNHEDAIARIEAFRQHEELRPRAVEILGPLYEQAGDWKRLVRLNEDRFSLAEDAHEKVQILRETAELWEQRGEDAERALQAYAQAVRLLPDEEDARHEFERLVSSTGNFPLLAEVYAPLLDAEDELVGRVEMVRQLADAYDQHLDDPRRALTRRLELLDLEPEGPDTTSIAIRLATLLGDWRALEKTLSVAADVSYEPPTQVGYLIALGELRHLTLDDVGGAIEAYERAFEIDERSPEVSDRLIALHEEAEDSERLAELYLARVAGEDVTDDVRYELNRRAAVLFETELQAPDRAIDCLCQALIAHPGDGDTVLELNRLYRAQAMWPELLDNLRLEAGTAPSAEKRLEIRHDIAEILAEKLNSFEEAIEAYGVVLDERPDDERAINAVFALAAREDHLARQAADLLVPALRQTSLKTRLVDALELRLTTEDDPAARVETLRSMAELQEQELANPAAALRQVLRAVADAPELVELQIEAERLGAITGSWSDVADALDKQAAELFEADVAAELLTRVGRIREIELKQTKEAISAYQKATEHVGDRQDLLDALDRLYTAKGDTAAVIELLERRIALADSDQAQSKILARQGQLQLEQQKRPDLALDTLRQALDRDLFNAEASELVAGILSRKEHFEQAFEILDSVYRDRSSGEDLAKLHQIRVKRAKTPEERIEMRRSLAEVLEVECKDPLSAQRVVAEGLLDDLSDMSVQDELERLAGLSGAWDEAAQALLVAVDAAGQGQAEFALELCKRAVAFQRDRAGNPEGAEAALVRALEFAPEDEDLLEQLDALQQGEGREVDLLGTVLRRAALVDGGLRLDLLRRARALAGLTGNDALGEDVLRKILVDEPDDVEALTALSELCRKKGDAQEAYELLLRMIELEGDPDIRRGMRVRAAEVARDELGRQAEATELLLAIFEENPTDQVVAESLQAAYVAEERFDELAELLARLIDEAADVGRRAELRVKLAHVELEQFEDADEAIALLEQVLADEAGHSEAALLLMAIYEDGQRFEDLAGLLDRQASQAFASEDVPAALRLQRRLAALSEETLQDLPRAARTWLAIRELDDSQEALEALLRIALASGEKAQAADFLHLLCQRAGGDLAVERRIELARLFMDLGDRDAVVRVLGEVQALAPDTAELRRRLRTEYERAGTWQPIADLLVLDAQAAEGTDKIALYREAAGIFQEKLGNAGAAADVLTRATEADPDNRDLLLELCDATSAAGRGADAVIVLERIVESYGGKRAKELGEIHRRLANAYLSQGEKEKALGELEKAFRIEPGNISVLRQLGDVAIDSGDLKKAQQMYRALLLQRLDDKSPISKAMVFCRLGQIHKLLDETPKAKQMFERALQADPGLAEAQAGLDSL